MATRKRNVRKRKNVNRMLLLGLFLVATLVVAAVAWVIIKDNAETESITEQTKNQDAGTVDQSPDKNNVDGSGSSGSSLPVTEPDKDIQHDTPSTGDTLNVWATLASVSGDTLLIRVQIDQNISSGTCELSIGSYKKSVPVAAQPQSASCDGFEVPTSAYSGDEFTVLVRSGDKSGSTTGKING